MPSRHRLDRTRRYRADSAQAPHRGDPPTKAIEIATDFPVPPDSPRLRNVPREEYLADERLADAVNLAIALGRPLLLQGEPGCGKTRLAHAVAWELGEPIEECYIKSTTKAQDLLYSYNAVNRLYDAQLGVDAPRGLDGAPKSADIRNYIRLQPLGRAIVRASYGRPSVVLIDEIDKADLDFPNDLLRELDRLEFEIPESEQTFKVPEDKPEWRPIIFVTHNEEKALPAAFLRRCIFYYVGFPEDRTRLESILATHHPEIPVELNAAVVTELLNLRKLGLTKLPGISELIDWATYVHASGLQPSDMARRPHIEAVLKQASDQEKALTDAQSAQRGMIPAVPTDTPGGFVWQLFAQLRSRRLPLGIDDYEALRVALCAGFGLSSRESLRELCCALWAKSQAESQIVHALFDGLKLPSWNTREETSIQPSQSSEPENKPTPSPRVGGPASDGPLKSSAPVLQQIGTLPPINVSGLRWSDRPFVFVPQYPVTYREAAQTWRRLRRPLRFGAPTELDVEATISWRARTGVVAPPVLVPPRRNVARLLLLLNRHGSMTPFHGFVDEMCAAIRKSGSLECVEVRYFHNLPSGTPDSSILNKIEGTLFPTLDGVLDHIHATPLGDVALDSTLLDFQPLDDVLAGLGIHAGVAIVSDAGASRRTYRSDRLLNSAVLSKSLRVRVPRLVWLNPVPEDQWKGTTAAQLRRHVPMFPMSRRGMHDAVQIMHGHPAKLESAL